MKKIRNILLCSALAITLVSCTSMQDVNTAKTYNTDDMVYSSQILDIEYASQTVTYSELAANLEKLTGAEITEGSDPVMAIVEATDFTKLALTYSEEKAASRMDHYGIDELGGFDAKYVACALDSHLLDAADFKALVSSDDSVSQQLAYHITMVVARQLGLARNYIGRASDSDIMVKVADTFNELYMYSESTLDGLGATLVQEKASTGFNIKQDGYDANFIPELTIKYGHCDELHLKQLIALLNSENIDAKIQIEPKTSIYEYLKEWGPFPETTPEYRVEQYSEDLALVHAVEYDVMFEFDNEADMQMFDSIINKYSKKNSENQAEGSTVKLIDGAWWQPLYSTSVSNLDESAYTLIYDNVATINGYSIHPYSLVDNSAALEAEMEELSGLDTVALPLYVNNAFYRYITGTSWE
jgi:hypothetical protein